MSSIVPNAGDAGVVDEHVETAVAFDGGIRDHRLDALRLSDVGDERRRACRRLS